MIQVQMDYYKQKTLVSFYFLTMPTWSFRFLSKSIFKITQQRQSPFLRIGNINITWLKVNQFIYTWPGLHKDQVVRWIWYSVESVSMTSVLLIMKTLWCNKHLCRVSIHYYMQYVLDKLWKLGYDLYFRDLKENFAKKKNEPRSLNDLDFWQTLWFIYSFTWLHLPIFTSQTKILLFYLFSFKSLKDQMWPCCKMSQGQPRVIILVNLMILKFLMLQTKFQGHQPTYSREENFWRIFTVYWYGAIFGLLSQTSLSNFHWPI